MIEKRIENSNNWYRILYFKILEDVVKLQVSDRKEIFQDLEVISKYVEQLETSDDIARIKLMEQIHKNLNILYQKIIIGYLKLF